MAGDIISFEPPRSSGGGGGGSSSTQQVQSNIPIIYGGSGVNFANELYLGPLGYSYSSGGGGYPEPLPVASTITRVMFKCAAMLLDVVVRLRTSAGVELWSKTLAAGDTSIDETVSLAVAAGVRVQWSITPVSGTPALDNCTFSWVRSLS